VNRITKNTDTEKNSVEQNNGVGLVVKSTGGLYYVEQTGGETVECRAKGSFRHDGISPLAGDRVTFEKLSDGTGFITEIHPRKNTLVRPAVANVDLLVVVSASADPDPDLFILDKLTAVAVFNGVDVMMVFNKNDVKSAESLTSLYQNAGFMALPMCAKDSEGYKEGLESIRRTLSGKTSFFTGASGVGKSSVMNALFPELSLVTGEISKKIQRGKHTTRLTELFKIDDGTYIGDTPGFSMLDVAAFRLIDSEGLLASFPDVAKYADGCKYKKCTHVCEDGCGVVKALEEGKIAKSRHDSYATLFKELKEIKPWMDE